jgi:hypothetical protein
VVAGTSSLPIKIDFSSCIPVEEVVVVAVVNSDKNYITINEYQRTLRNDGDTIFTNPFVSFVF